MGVLICADPEVLHDAPNCALGLPPDTPEAATNDCKLLSVYHPLQALGCMVPAYKSALSKQSATQGVNLALPQATFDTTYDLGLLIDRKRVAEFGPILSTVAGLNYKLVERLKTIRITAKVPTATPIYLSNETNCDNLPASEELSITFDGGKTHRQICSPQKNQDAVWAPLAGLKPRALRHAELCSEIVSARDLSGASPEKQFANAIKLAAKTSDCNVDSLLIMITKEFEKLLTNVSSPLDFKELAAGSSAIEPNGYLTLAFAAYYNKIFDEFVQIIHASTIKTPIMEIIREARITSTIQVMTSAQEFLRRLSLTIHARESFTHGPVPESDMAFMVADLRRAVKAALALEPLVCNQPSLKLFVATKMV